MKSKLHLNAIIVMMAIFCFSSLSSFSQTYEIGETATAPTIDGTIEAEWDAMPKYLAVDPTTWTANFVEYLGLDDIHFTWSGMWDATNLYLLFEVTDDATETGDPSDSQGNYWWMSDNIEMVINDPGGSENTYKYRFAYGRDGEDLEEPDQPDISPNGFNFVTADVTGGYVIEAIVPWATLLCDTLDFSGYPAVGKTLNCNITAADLDIENGAAWDMLSGHVQWPVGWGSADITLVSAITTMDDTPPAAVANLAASGITFNSCNLSWDQAADADVVGYLIMANGGQLSYVADPATVTAAISGLEPETEYDFTIYAVDDQNISAESSAATITTGMEPVEKLYVIEKYEGSYPNAFDDLDFWDAVEAEDLNYVVGGSVDDELDLAANYKVAWDNLNLYMQVNVADQELENSFDSPTEGWKNDNAEYHFDMLNERDGTSTDESSGDDYQQDNFQYRTIPYLGGNQTGSSPAPDWTGITQNTFEYFGEGVTAIGYTMEINFPWAAINATSGENFRPDDKKKFGFDLKVSDQDPSSTGGSIAWCTYGFDNLHTDNSQYGQIELSGEGVGIKKLGSETLSLYPNPCSDFVIIEVPESFTGQFSIYDIAGKEILNHSMQNVSGQVLVNIEQIESGVYFASMSNGKTTLNSKLIVR